MSKTVTKAKLGFSKEDLNDIVDFISKDENVVCAIAAPTGVGKSSIMIQALHENGAKVFDKEEGLLKMSTKYWEMYKHLKNEIGNDN